MKTRNSQGMRSAAAIVAALIYVSVSRAAALKCLSCIAAARPRDCEYVQECGVHEKCSIESILTTAGYTTYNVGCTDRNKCASFGKKRAAFNATSLQGIQQKDEFREIPEEQWDQGGRDLVLCAECCDAELCNVKGCGEEGLPKDSGPVCYGCEQTRDPYKCNKIVLCGRDEACHLSSKIIGVDQVYKSECIARQACQDLLNTGANLLIGRRQSDVDMSSKLKRSVLCNKCCTDNLCNFGNCSSLIHPSNPPPQTTILAPADGQWSLWTTWSVCSQTCGTGGTRNRQRTCDNPPPSAGGKVCVGQPYVSQPCDGLSHPQVIQSTQNFTEPAGSNIVIKCLVSSSTSQQHVPSIQWLAPQTIGHEPPTNVEEADDGSLYITGLTVENTGPYSCQVITACGTYTSAQFWVNIQ